MGKVSIIDQDPERKQHLVQLFAEGTRHAAIAEVFGVHVDTVGDWKKRPDIQAGITAYIRKRSNDILALTDHAIQKRLEAARDTPSKQIPTETLLSIRKTFAGERINVNTEGDAAGATEELMALLHEHPELAAAFAGATSGADAD